MTINIDYILRKMMGWCPQEKIVYRTGDEFILDHTYCGKAHTDNNSIHEDMYMRKFIYYI